MNPNGPEGGAPNPEPIQPNTPDTHTESTPSSSLPGQLIPESTDKSKSDPKNNADAQVQLGGPEIKDDKVTFTKERGRFQSPTDSDDSRNTLDPKDQNELSSDSLSDTHIDTTDTNELGPDGISESTKSTETKVDDLILQEAKKVGEFFDNQLTDIDGNPLPPDQIHNRMLELNLEAEMEMMRLIVAVSKGTQIPPDKLLRSGAFFSATNRYIRESGRAENFIPRGNDNDLGPEARTFGNLNQAAEAIARSIVEKERAKRQLQPFDYKLARHPGRDIKETPTPGPDAFKPLDKYADLLREKPFPTPGPGDFIQSNVITKLNPDPFIDTRLNESHITERLKPEDEGYQNINPNPHYTAPEGSILGNLGKKEPSNLPDDTGKHITPLDSIIKNRKDTFTTNPGSSIIEETVESGSAAAKIPIPDDPFRIMPKSTPASYVEGVTKTQRTDKPGDLNIPIDPAAEKRPDEDSNPEDTSGGSTPPPPSAFGR